jgi:hypothetical protein
MLRLIVILVLGLFTTPHIQSQDTEPPTDIFPITSDRPTIPMSTFEQPTTTEQRPFRPTFFCNFNTSCFGNGQLKITNGSEFNSPDLSDTSEPPRAPTSDVTSITQPTNNSEICKLPYRPLVNNGAANASWETWFCTNNACPTANSGIGGCEAGSYGFLSLNTSNTTEIIIDSLTPNTLLRDAFGNQCLRFYYYFTVYNGFDSGQQIQLWMRPNNETANQLSIRNLTVTEMVDNKWNFQNIDFNSSFINYTLAFLFILGDSDPTTDPRLNQTVYFALDDIELYSYTCSDVNNSFINPTITQQQTTQPFTTQSPSTNQTGLPPVTESTNKLPLILGLSIGIGVPVLLAVIGGLIYYFKVYKPRQKIIPKNDTTTTNTTTAAITDIPMAPIKTTGDYSTIAAVVA